MSLPIKLGVGALALGSAVGVGYGAVNYFSQEDKKVPINEPKTKPLADLIKEKYQYILLNFSEQGDNPDKAHWDKIWADYKSENSTGTNPFQLQGWAERDSKDLTGEIKKKCSQLSSSMILNEEEKPYQDVTKYCSRGVTLADEATNSGLTVIKNTDNSLDTTTWNEKLGQKTNLKQHFDKLGLTSEGLTAENVRTKCKEIESKKKQDSEYQATLPAYKEVCANPK